MRWGREPGNTGVLFFLIRHCYPESVDVIFFEVNVNLDVRWSKQCRGQRAG